MSRKFILIVLIVLTFKSGFSQFLQESTLTGSLESNSLYYVKDHAFGFIPPESPFATNNYLKLNYRYKFFEAGLQYENYLPPLMGYSQNLEGHRLVHRYISASSKSQKITVGNFYEQFGSGLAFRTYEDRALGINTSLDGIKYVLNPIESISLTGLAGKQLGYKKNGKSLMFGGKLEVSVSELLSLGKNTVLEAETGWFEVKRHEDENDLMLPKANKSASTYYGSMFLFKGNFSLHSELVKKSYDPSEANGVEEKKGTAFIVNPTWSKKGIGANLIFRRLKRMAFSSELFSSDQFFMLNFIPANCKQHKYSLANLNPYSAQAKNELSWQADLFYLIPKKSTLGGKYGAKIAVNYSRQYANIFNDLSFKELTKSENLLYRDFNIEIDKRWDGKMKSIISFISLNMENNFFIRDDEAQKSNIIVADLQYKIKPKKTLRMEMQHLWAETRSENWYAWHAEYSVAPRWSLFISDMVNYAGSNIHFPNGGIQLHIKSTSLQFNYGRNRAGYKCSGGICRWMPAYTGFGFSVSGNF